MSSRFLLGGALLAAALACTDSVTGPAALTADGSKALFDQPPPPPIDSSMATFDGSSTHTLNVTYFYNRSGNNAWLSFSRKQAPGVIISPNARVMVSQGRAAARGTLSIAMSGGTWTADLAKAISSKSLEAFGSCKYECARLTMNGKLVYRNGESDNKTLVFQFRSFPTEVDIIDVR